MAASSRTSGPHVDGLDRVWMDGEIKSWENAQVHLLTHSLHYGTAAFEGIRAYKRSDGNTYVFRLREHIRRLMDSCKLVMIEPQFSEDQIVDACVQVLRENGGVEAYLRPLVYLADGAMGLYAPDNFVATAIIAWRWGAFLGEEGLKHGVRTKIAAWPRNHISASLSKGKITGQYTNSTLAKREAKLAGYEEAILLDTNGFVAEGPGENIFIVRDGVLRTPPLSAAILEGITRDSVLVLAREAGIVVEQGMITRDQLYLADEAFFTGTAAEVTPIREVDNRRIGTGLVGPVTKRLQERFFGIVRGPDDSHPEWLTKV